ncbi:uncharacterized protein LOC119080844 [Bradysia coprophila]|uniref:uncharacterized protein LOC119080844 n=1 Tax=Bradysia coprophila TaxID=38358 RepID=UPI00187D878F|nr:uncharacterized protein LOC119080844 [Bradysia coprophila]XP_037045301.1 uncharacterized protein LOC119080844 [Bradysia coprophila]
MTSDEINHPSIRKSRTKLQSLLAEGILQSISKGFLLCNACKSKIKVSTNGDFCLNQHLKTKKHLFILRESSTDWPEILKKTGDPDDRFHAQREKYERKLILARVPGPYKEWIDVKYNEFAYRFYCQICSTCTMSNVKRDLEKHMLSESHQQNLHKYLNKVKCGKGSITLETFVDRYIGTPKKSLETKDVPTPRTTPASTIKNSKKLQIPKIPHMKRDPQSTQISKVARKDSIRIYYQNVQSIRGNRKKSQFNRNLAKNYDVIVFTETWLEQASNLQIFDEGFDVYRCDRSTDNTYKLGYGGVLVAVSSKLYSDLVIVQGFDFLEYVCLKLLHNDHFVYIYCLYIPGELKKDIAPQHIKAIEAINCDKGDTFIVVGDFNMPGIEWKSSADNTFFQPDKLDPIFQLLQNKKLYQLNNIKNIRGNVLDLIFVNNPNTSKLSPVNEQQSLMPIIDVHPPFEIVIDSLNFPSNLTEAAKKKAYSIRKAYIQHMEKFFDDLDWDYFERNMDHLLSNFVSDTHTQDSSQTEFARHAQGGLWTGIKNLFGENKEKPVM